MHHFVDCLDGFFPDGTAYACAHARVRARVCVRGRVYVRARVYARAPMCVCVYERVSATKTAG